MPRARPSFAGLLAIACLVLCLAPACSSGGGGGGASGQTCPAAYDGGAGLGGTVAENEGGQCANLLTGTAGNGQACQQSSECVPTCCACPSGGRSAQVALCREGQCVVGADVCCAWIDENSTDSDAGPFVCSH